MSIDVSGIAILVYKYISKNDICVYSNNFVRLQVNITLKHLAKFIEKKGRVCSVISSYGTFV